MLSAATIVKEIASLTVNEVFRAYALSFRAAAMIGWEGGRAAAAALKGNDASGSIELIVEEGVLAATDTPRDKRQDLVNELVNLIAGYFESEFLRRGVAVKYAQPRAVVPSRSASFESGPDGVLCCFEHEVGHVALAVQLTLLEGARLESLPTRRLPARKGVTRKAEGPRPKSAQVLVVDDSASARANVVGLLSEEGFEVLQADSGLSALELLRAQPSIGIVFTDFHMAGVNGAELIRRMRADEKTAQVPVVVLTASARALDEIDPSQVMTCLMKPISAAAVISLARRVLLVAN